MREEQFSFLFFVGLVHAIDIDLNHLTGDVKPAGGNERLEFRLVNEGIILPPIYDVHRERYVFIGI